MEIISQKLTTGAKVFQWGVFEILPWLGFSCCPQKFKFAAALFLSFLSHSEFRCLERDVPVSWVMWNSWPFSHSSIYRGVMEGVLPPRFSVLLINVWPVPLECKNSCVSGSFSPFYVPLYHKLQHHIHLFTSCSFQIGRRESLWLCLCLCLCLSLAVLGISLLVFILQP